MVRRLAIDNRPFTVTLGIDAVRGGSGGGISGGGGGGGGSSGDS